MRGLPKWFSILLAVSMTLLWVIPATAESPACGSADTPIGPLHSTSITASPSLIDDASGEYIVKLTKEAGAGLSLALAMSSDTGVSVRTASFPFGHPASRYVVIRANAGADGWSLGQLARDSVVENVEPNAPRYADFAPDDPLHSLQANFARVEVPQAWDLAQGAGVTVAVIDTGVAYETFGGFTQAPDLAGTIFAPGWDFVNGDDHPNDDHGHGTHVAGTIAQTTNNGEGVAGIAFRSSIMPIKVLNINGSGSCYNVGLGIMWAVDHGAQVINLSLGGANGCSIEEDAINYAFSRGVTVVAASGNENSAVSYPAAYENAIAVGAVDADNNRADFSNYGSALDIVAPGTSILQQTFSNSPSAFYYLYWTGTSMATPHVAGVAALLYSLVPAASATAIRSALQSTSLDLGAAGWDQYYGSGLVQAHAAALRLQNSIPATPTPASTPAPSPTATRTSVPSPTSTPSPSPTRTPSPIPSSVPTVSPTPTSIPPVAPPSDPLSGPRQAAPNDACVFVSVLPPDTTSLPVTYEWHAQGLAPVVHTELMRTSDSATFTWTDSGSKVLLLRVIESNGATTEYTHNVSISQLDAVCTIFVPSLAR